MVGSEQPPRLDEPLQILSWLEGPDTEDIRQAEARARALGGERFTHTGVRDDEPLGLDSQRRHRVIGRVTGVREDDVTRVHGVGVLASVHRDRPRCAPLRVMQRIQVVDRRRTQPRTLRRRHPVGGEERIEGSEQALGGRMPENAPGGAHGV